MFDPLTTATDPAQTAQLRGQKVLRMVTNDRMAGSIPAWVRADDANAGAAEQVGRTLTAASTQGGKFSDILGDTMSYAPAAQLDTPKPFGIGDLVDVINPLQHIPVLSSLYRSFTGDDISGAARVAGATVYGGPLGAMASLANIALEEGTGRDFTGNVLALASGKGIDIKPALAAGSPEERLNNVVAANDAATPDIPAVAQTFAETPPQTGLSASADTTVSEIPTLLQAQEIASAAPAPAYLHNQASRYNG